MAKNEEAPKKAEKRESAKKLIAEALKRYKKCVDADNENRMAYREDMLFTYKPGEQWLEQDKTDRGKDRPMYEFNETRVKNMTVINHIRANRPAAKIRGVEEGDKELAEIRQGLYLNVTNNSDFDSIKDYAAGHQVSGGIGFWRVDTEYSTDTAFDQDIVIRNVMNPMCVYADCSDKDELKRNAKYWFVHSKMPNEEFDAKYPEADRVGFDPDEALENDLDDDESTWIAEYWKKVPTVKNICLLSNGQTVEKEEGATYPEGVTVVREKKVNTFKIVQYIISGKAILEGPNEWAGSMFPFVPVYGYYIVIDGKIYWGGLTRYIKDSQRALNWAMTSVIETVSASPQAKYWATPKQALGNTNQWAEANRKNIPAMLYNPDPEAPGEPKRMGGADVPVALIQVSQMTSGLMNTTSGITLANEGRVSNETSGRAIRARQDEGMVATFNFGDNMAKSERRTCEIVNDLIPKIYDTERSIRILGQDGAEKYLKINARDPVTGEVINDMSAGKFDFVVTTGPSFATQRQEAAEFYGQMMQTNPAFAAGASDLVLKAQDYPMSDAMAERMKLMLPPQIQAAINKDKPMPPEVAQAMALVEQLQQQVAMAAQQVAEAGQEAQKQTNAAQKAQADVKVAAASLETKSAEINAQEAVLAQKVAEFKTLVAETEARIAAENLEQKSNEDRVALSKEVKEALAFMQEQASQLVNGYAQQLAQMVATTMPKKAASKTAKSMRTPEGTVTVIEERDEAGNVIGRKRALQRRVNGQIDTQMETIPDETVQ